MPATMTPHERAITHALSGTRVGKFGTRERRQRVSVARSRLAAVRERHGFKRDAPVVLLTAPAGNLKMSKSERPTYGLALSPSTLGGWNTCPASTPQCRATCLHDTGNGRYDSAQRGRAWKTDALRSCPDAFVTVLVHELDLAVRRHDGGIAVRLNILSDIVWEHVVPSLFTTWGDRVRFYDYSKRYDRGAHPAPNYTLTLSATERTDETAVRLMVSHHRANVAVVFDTPRTGTLPATYGGAPVVDGDESDDRTADPVGVVVGLRAKGTARSLPVGDDSFVKPGA